MEAIIDEHKVQTPVSTIESEECKEKTEQVSFPEFLYKSFEAIFEVITKSHQASIEHTNTKLKDIDEHLKRMEDKLQLDVQHATREIMIGLKESDEEWIQYLMTTVDNRTRPILKRQGHVTEVVVEEEDDGFVADLPQPVE